MPLSPLRSPVALDGVVSSERLKELLALGSEHPEVDFKSAANPSNTSDIVELAADVGAMQVRGGYIVVGVDDSGAPTRGLDGVDVKLFDEARLRPKLLKHLPEPLDLRIAVHKQGGSTVVLMFVGRHPSGCAIFRADGQYPKGKQIVTRFRQGDVFWRNGTSSERISQQGFEEIIERRIADAKTSWIEEQQEIRRREREELQTAYESRRLADAPLGTVTFDLPLDELVLAVLELIRAGDQIALRQLFRGVVGRARDAIERGEIETELAEVLDKLTCLAATFLEYEQREWFERVIGTLSQIYSLPLRDADHALSFGLGMVRSPEAKPPRVWLQVIERVFALGALAVHRENWPAVRTLTLQVPEHLPRDYEVSWLRHALTMASRAQHLDRQEDGRQIFTSLLTLARAQVARLECLRPDGRSAEDDAIFTDLAQFDILSNLVAIDSADSDESRVFYPNFARFRQERIEPVVKRLLSDAEMRLVIFPRSDQELAMALQAIAKIAHEEGFRYDGFSSWANTPAGDFIAQHAPPTG